MEIPAPQIIRSRRSSISLHITREGELIVKAPHLKPKFFNEQFNNSKKDWIDKTFAKIQQRQPSQKTYHVGEEFLFLGKSYALQFYNGITILMKEEKLFFPKALEFRIQKELTNWYMRQAKEIITTRVAYHAKQMKAEYKSLLFSDTKSKWGTCFPDNALQFNWRLIMAPLMVIDYVVIHELTHTTEKHHQDSFWRRVRLFTPAYKQHRKWLEQHAHLLSV